MNALFKHAGNGMNAGFIQLLFNGRDGQVQGFFGNQLCCWPMALTGNGRKSSS